MSELDRISPGVPVTAASHLTVTRLSESEFLAARQPWGELVAQSDADPLFMSWPWLSAWWETWGRELGLELLVLVVKNADEWVGIAPCYIARHSRRFSMRVDRIHFLGNAWRIAPTVRTEYVDIIAPKAWREGVGRALEAWLMDQPWDELVICDHVDGAIMGETPEPPDKPSVFSTLVQADLRAEASGWLRVRRKLDYGVRINTQGQFGDWLASLSKSSRLKIYNRRQYLDARAQLAFVQPQDHAWALQMGLLNRFHQQRWGRPCFEGKSLDFHRRLLTRLEPTQQVQFSNLLVDGQVHSVLYDIAVGRRVYNIQAGFDENFDPKIALGSLHLGYAIERAFLHPDLDAYDLLAGGGKHSFYKAHFKGQEVIFETYQLVRNPLLKLAYRAYMRLPQVMRRPMLRMLTR